MKLADIKKLTSQELQKELTKSRIKLRELHFSAANKQLKNVREVRLMRRTIGRLMTVMAQSDKKMTAGEPKA